MSSYLLFVEIQFKLQKKQIKIVCKQSRDNK